jgi:predicted transcriptional regulator
MRRERRSGGARRRPGELEADVLSVLWDAGEPLAGADVQTRFGADLAFSTIATILTRLHSKGLVTRTTRGRTHLYEPSFSRSDYVAEEVRRLLDQGDRPAVLQGFLDGLSKEDERALRRLLEPATEPRRTKPRP